MSGRRSWNEVKAQTEQRWLSRCGPEPIVDPTRNVEVTGRWADDTAIHSSHRVNVAGVRSRGCEHAFPRLGWSYVERYANVHTVCKWADCPASESN